MTDITLPDFDKWASCLRPEQVKEALIQAFEQGKSLGVLEGRELIEKEWWIEQDASLEGWDEILKQWDKTSGTNDALKELMNSKAPWEFDNE